MATRFIYGMLLVSLLFCMTGCCERHPSSQEQSVVYTVPESETGSPPDKGEMSKHSSLTGKKRHSRTSGRKTTSQIKRDLARANEYWRRGMEMAAVRHLDKVLSGARENDYLLRTKSHYLLYEIYKAKNLERESTHHWNKFLENHKNLSADQVLAAQRKRFQEMADFFGKNAGIEEKNRNDTEETTNK